MDNDNLLSCKCGLNKIRGNIKSTVENEKTIFIEKFSNSSGYGSDYDIRFVCLNCGNQYELSRYSERAKYVIDLDFLYLTNDDLRKVVNNELEFIKSSYEFEAVKDKFIFSYLCLYYIFNLYDNILSIPLVKFSILREKIISAVYEVLEITDDIKEKEINNLKNEVLKKVKFSFAGLTDTDEIMHALKNMDFSSFTNQKEYGLLSIESVYNINGSPIRNFEYKVNEYFKKKEYAENEKNIKSEIMNLQKKLIKTAINLLRQGDNQVEITLKNISSNTYYMVLEMINSQSDTNAYAFMLQEKKYFSKNSFISRKNINHNSYMDIMRKLENMIKDLEKYLTF